ncbi:putative oxidoreductase [bacterium A37T11]|nr:putative oxidoreductase [bacterium A37T11]
MKKFFSIKYSPLAFNIGTFLLRLSFGVFMAVPHGYDKLVHFSSMKDQFMGFLGLGSAITLGLCIFAEFFCSILLIAGLFTRLAVIPLIINMLVAGNMHKWELFGDHQLAFTFLVSYFTILLLGPGKFSLDGLMKGR